ncbi:DUF2628 domain-containing protein [Rummeliibacillus sp. G93]|uniref:DUF2628 domain-containing protein n=1 Tax=Rummeliibacillus TaxID=648802 RepID=UPI00201C51D7|nr:DUF2628 domain-containing protein [Rummeliibacillus sp. G93]UQW97818.1 DUF2628 domain-containing protein [Rummeliibacillus sp. G93]
MKVNLKNSAGVMKNVKVGFSWTTFFFGFFPALFRGDLKWAIIMFIVAAALGSFTFGLGGMVADIIFAFIYNKIYIKELLEKQYSPADEQSEQLLHTAGVIA